MVEPESQKEKCPCYPSFFQKEKKIGDNRKLPDVQDVHGQVNFWEMVLIITSLGDCSGDFTSWILEQKATVKHIFPLLPNGSEKAGTVFTAMANILVNANLWGV